MPQSGILGMFARSPVRPLQRHMEKAHACAAELLPFFNAILKDDWKKATSLQQKISTLEKEADDIKIDLRTHLPKSIFLPVHRHDVLTLLDEQEQIANISKDIAGIILGRKMQIPHEISDVFIRYLERCIDASSQAKKAISELDELLESGFRGKEVKLVESMIQELNKIEHETDEIQIQLRQSLFDIEKELQPINAIFLYQIIDWIGRLADSAQHAGNRLRMLTSN